MGEPGSGNLWGSSTTLLQSPKRDLLLFLCSRDHPRGLARWKQLWEKYGVSSDSGTKAGEKGGYRGKTGRCEKREREDKQGLGSPVLEGGENSHRRTEGNLVPSSTLLPSFPWPQVPLAVPPGSSPEEAG